MEVSYKIFDSIEYSIRCEEHDIHYPNGPYPTVEEFTYKGTGKVVGYIDGGFFRKVHYDGVCERQFGFTGTSQ